MKTKIQKKRINMGNYWDENRNKRPKDTLVREISYDNENKTISINKYAYDYISKLKIGNQINFDYQINFTKSKNKNFFGIVKQIYKDKFYISVKQENRNIIMHISVNDICQGIYKEKERIDKMSIKKCYDVEIKSFKIYKFSNKFVNIITIYNPYTNDYKGYFVARLFIVKGGHICPQNIIVKNENLERIRESIPNTATKFIRDSLDNENIIESWMI